MLSRSLPNCSRVSVVGSIVLTLALSGCRPEGQTPGLHPGPVVTPDVTIRLNPEVTEVPAGAQVAIAADTTARGGPEFTWSVDRGRLSKNEGPSVIYEAPGTPGLDTVDLIVTTDAGVTTRTVTFTVLDVFRHGEIQTPNLACSMTVTATASSWQDSTGCYGCSPVGAVDCVTETRWSSDWPHSEKPDDEWIALEFDEPVAIDSVVLKWELAYGRAYTIDVSDDGNVWTSIYAETNGTGEIDEIHFPLVTTRHIRMHGRVRGDVQGEMYGYSLIEFEVYRAGAWYYNHRGRAR